jgi:hypothetical protein
MGRDVHSIKSIVKFYFLYHFTFPINSTFNRFLFFIIFSFFFNIYRNILLPNVKIKVGFVNVLYVRELEKTMFALGSKQNYIFQFT